MNNLFQQFSAWRGRRHQTRLARWERTRAQGKPRFIIRESLIWGGTMILFMSFMDVAFDGRLNLRKLLWTMTYLVIVSPIMMLATWWSNEGRFTSARIDSRMKAIEKMLANNRET